MPWWKPTKNIYTKSEKDETNNTNQIQSNNDNVEIEYEQGENILTIGIEKEQENPGKSHDKVNKSKNLKETNKNIITLKISIKFKRFNMLLYIK